MDVVDVARPRTVVIVTYEGVQALDITGPHEVFSGATALLEAAGRQDAGYAPTLASPRPGMVRSESGLTVVAGALDDVGEVDTLLVPGGGGVTAAAADDRLVATVAALADPLPAHRRCLQRRLPARRGRAAGRPAGDHPLGPSGAAGPPAPRRRGRRRPDLDPRRRRVDVGRGDRRDRRGPGPRRGRRRGRDRRVGRPLARHVPAPARRSEPVRRPGVAGPGPGRARPSSPGPDRDQPRRPTTASACWRRTWR